MKVGTVTIKANINTIVEQSIVTITFGEPTSILISPGTEDHVSISSGSTLQFTAYNVDFHGNTKQTTMVMWTVVNGTGSATVDSNGKVTGVKVG